MLSVIIPAFNEGENIRRIAGVLSSLLTAERIDYELIFVDDGSQDITWREIFLLVNEEACIKGVRFSRNFGKEGAVFAGLHKASGEAAVVIDCDMQHPPELIPRMYAQWKSGYEVVEAVKKSRGREGLMYKAFAGIFYRAMKGAGMSLDRASDYKLLDRKVINSLLEMPERLTFFRALSSWVGFSRIQVEFEVGERYAGKSKWNFRKLMSFAIANLTSFTDVPMQLMTFTGAVFFLFAAGLGTHTLVQYIRGVSLTGFTTVILLILLTGSLLMFGLGILGYYVAKIYEEIKFRPRYIIAEESGFNEAEPR